MNSFDQRQLRWLNFEFLLQELSESFSSEVFKLVKAVFLKVCELFVDYVGV